MTALIPFDFHGQAVRTATLDGDPVVVLTDIAKVLGYRDANSAGRILRDHHKGYAEVRTPGGTQQMLVITERGFNRLVIRSNAANAEEVQDWITDEVLPTIRRTGGYLTPVSELDELQVAERYVAALRDKKALAAKVAELTPDAEAWQILVQRAGNKQRTVSQAAALLDEHPRISMGRNRLFRYMHEEMGWIYRDGLGNWTPHQKVRDRDLLRFPLSPDDVSHWDNQVMVTPKGLNALWAQMTALFFAQPELPLEASA